jgi:hypothetical protein
VVALIKSIPMMADVFVLAMFYLSIFGIACVELFMGKLDMRCGEPDFTYAFTGSEGLVQVRAILCCCDNLSYGSWASHQHLARACGMVIHLYAYCST